MSQTNDKLELYIKKLRLLEEEKMLREKFPHMYAHKFYTWSREFLDDWENRTQILTSGNQVSKTSTLIKKLINLAISPDKWKELWPELPVGMKPSQWWFCCPTKEMATIEFHEKWVPLLPKVPEDDPLYGWKVDKRSKFVLSVNFNSGINIYFKTYAQDVHSLQGGSCYVMALDEEVPVHLLQELQMRTSATNGFMLFVFTATLGQRFWKEVVEDRTQWKHAKVRQVSLFDCQYYEDGSPSIWTPERIQTTIDKCTSKAEVQKRIYGKFVKDEGLRYMIFDRELHSAPFHPVPKNWDHYAGIDYGSGGERGHPSAISIVAVNPERTKIRLVRHWRGDGIQTTAQDLLNQYVDMTRGLNITAAYYDYAARDLKTIADRSGLNIIAAEKRVDVGEGIIRSLFKSQDALILYTHNDKADEAGIPPELLQTERMMEEFETLSDVVDKRAQKDDSIDSLRYALVLLPVNWEALSPYQKKEEEKKQLSEMDYRRGKGDEVLVGMPTIDEEIEFWQQQIEE